MFTQCRKSIGLRKKYWNFDTAFWELNGPFNEEELPAKELEKEVSAAQLVSNLTCKKYHKILEVCKRIPPKAQCTVPHCPLYLEEINFYENPVNIVINADPFAGAE